MPFVQLRGLRFYFERKGEGRPLLYFNGSGGDLRRRPGPFDGPLAEHFDLLAHDQRGLGQTERRDVPCTMADYAADAAALLDHVGWQSCSVFGISFGGMVAQEFAVTFPERVERLVLCCTSSGGEGGASYPLHELEDLSPDERPGRSVELADRRLDAKWRAEHPEAFERIQQMVDPSKQPGFDEPGRAIGARRQMEARRGHDTWDRLPRLACPTLLCGGRYDDIAPAHNMEALHGRIPGSKLEMFEGGHMFLLQDASAFPRILEFLRD